MTSKSKGIDNHPSRHLQPSTWIDLLKWRARHQVEQAAYTFLIDGETEGDQLSYGALDLQARGIASRLARHAARGDRVLLLYPPGLGFIPAFYGCLYAGLVAVPAYPPDLARLNRSLPRLRAIIQDAQARIVLTTSEILSMAKLLSAQVAEFDALHWLATDVPLIPEEDWEGPSISATDIAFLQYTSGSTGTPKGVILTHDNLLHNASLVFQAMAHTPTDKYVSWLPMFHDMGFMAGVLQPLYAGIQAVLLSPLAFLQKPVRWLQAISRYQATTSGGPNFAYDLCVRKVTPEQRATLDLSYWTVAFNGAEPVRAETLERFAREFASCGFRREAFYPCYGLAEATLIVSGGQKAHPAIIHRAQSRALEQNRAIEASTDSESAQSLVSCGRPLGDQQLTIVNHHSLTRCSPGEVGEIWVAGPSVAQGYWNRQDETTKTFGARLPDMREGPFLRTGDVGFLSDGELFITGRIKDLIIIRGRNLYPQDIELTAERSHAALRPGCGAAFAVEVAGQEQLVVVQEVNPLPQVNGDDIINAIRQAIIEEHEVPVYAITLIKPQSIAKTSSGKIQRHACRYEFLRGGLATVAQWIATITNVTSAPNHPIPAPVSATSSLDRVAGWLVNQVAAKLGLNAEQIDPDEPITHYGLDSLMAVELMHEFESYLGVSLPLVSFLDGTSLIQVAAQAQALAKQPGSAATASLLASVAENGSALPLSSGQRALWFLHRLAPESAAYNIIFAARIHGALDDAALRRALQFLVDRHACLRATFTAPQGEPFQHFQHGVQVSFQVTVATDWSASRLKERLSEQGHLPFDLERGPLLRVALFTRSTQEHILFLVVHHIVADLWSLSVMMQELGEAYAAETQGRLPALPALELQFADYARWEASLLAGQEGDRLWRYWRDQLAGPLPALDLPTDRPRPPIQTYRGASQAFYLDGDLSLKVQALAHARGTTLYMTLLAAFQTLLYHYTGQEDILVGTPTAGRTSAHLARLVGYFVNPIVLRARLSAQMTFTDFLHQVRQTVLAAFDHQGLPFPQLVERLQPKRELARSPLFQAMFILQKAHLLKEDELALFALGEAGARMPLGDLELESLALEQRVAPFDLTLMAAEVRSRLVLSWQYNADLFDEQTIARMAGHFQVLLERIVAAPEQRLGDYSLLNGPERQRLLAQWNATATPPEDGGSIHQLFQAQAECTPDAVAVEFQDERLTYRELNHRSNQLARHLRRLGIGAESPVGICMPRCPQMIVGLLGILKAGAAYVPLDPAYPKERLKFMLADSRPTVLLTTAQLRDELGLAARHSLCLDSDWPVVASQSGDTLASPDSPDHLAYVIYTSGSTGVPKGVLGLHRGAINRFQWMWRAYPFAAADVCCQKTSLSFVDSIWEIFGPLLKGVKVVLIPDDVVKDPQRLRGELAARHITRIVVVPALLRTLLDSCDDLHGQLPELKYWVTSGEALSKELAERFFERLPGRTLINLYGSSEVSADATCYEVSNRREPLAIPIGRPIANTTAYVLGAALQLLPVGVPGQLCIGGAGLARGYHNRPDLTAERFLPDPFGEPGGRLYMTGDIARTRANSEIDYLGRADQQLKIRGFRVELGEIEAALSQSPAVRECAVVATEPKSGDQQLVAYFVAAATRPTDAQLRAHLRERLPDYMIPAGFVPLEALPLTPNGKVNRRALPAWQTADGDSETGYVAAQTDMERGIAAIWRDVLRLKAVGVNDNFFDLGGHSILLTQVQSRLRKLIDRDVSIVELFKYPSISSLARYLAPSPGEACAAAAVHVRRTAFSDAAGARLLNPDIAIVGMAGRFPGADNLDEFWRNLRDGVESISCFTDQELQAFGVPDTLLKDARFVKAGALLREPDGFDASFFGYSPREAELMDPQHRLFLECAWHALEDAGYDSESYKGSVGVYSGMSLSTYLLFNLLPHRELVDSEDGFQVMLGGDKDFLSTRISYKLNLRGPSVAVQTACSTSLVAVHLACESLRAQRCDMALAGGVSITLPQRSGYLYQDGGILSPDGHCRAFDAKAQGTLFGSGVGIVVLKRLEDALVDGDSIHAVIKGSAINNDGSRKVGYTAPSIDGQAQVIADALAMAGAGPETITYLEAHGTATPLGDPVEVAALTQAFGGGTPKKGFCALGSVKTNIGHLDAAAGIAGLIKSILALKHRMLPPSLHFESPNPKIDFADSPFYVNAALSEWRANGAPRRAGVSSFGIGGTNAHLVLEEAPTVETLEADSRQQLLVLSARTGAALERATTSLVEYLKQNPASNLADVAYTLQVGRRRFNHGRILIAEDRDAAIRDLEARDPRRVLTQVQEPLERPVAFMFSGQGSQYVNMGLELYHSEMVFRQQVDRCAELLEPGLGSDLRDLLYPGETGIAEARQRLTQTAIAQPALFVIEYALAQLWIHYGVRPQAMLGHSSGEYVAACLAGVFSLEDALSVVSARGRLMQQLAPGAMLAVPLSERELLSMLDERLAIAAINGASLCVVSGPTDALQEFERHLARIGVEGRRLHTSHAFHSAMMEPILESFMEQVSRVTLKPPRIAYLSNVTGTWITAAEATDPSYYARHLRQPVRFASALGHLLTGPNRVLLEVGPGQTLSGLARQHPEQQADHVVLPSLRHPHEKSSDDAFFLNTLGRLWLSRVPIDWSQPPANRRRQHLHLPTYPFERQRYWIDPPRPQAGVVSAAKLGKQPDMADWFYAPIWKQSVLPARLNAAAPTDSPSRWLVCLDADELGRQLVERLRKAGHEVITVRPGRQFEGVGYCAYTIDFTRRDDYAQLYRVLSAANRLPDAILHLWSLSESKSGGAAAAFQEFQDRGFYSLLFLMQAFGELPRVTPLRLYALSDRLCAVESADVPQPEKATLLAACRVIAQEYPQTTCRCIDVALPPIRDGQPARLVQQILAEINDPESEPLVAYRGQQRWLQVFEPVRLAGDAPDIRALRQQGVYLITGGLGLVGLRLAEYLARTVQATLILTRRAPFPPPAEWDQWLSTHGLDDEQSRKIIKLRSLEDFGARVVVACADVSRKDQMRALIEDTYRRFGQLNGVIHAAGVVGEQAMKLIADLDPHQCESHFRAKVYGAYALAEVLQGRALDFCLLCSSTAAILGGVGSAGYAAANLFLDAFARHHSRDDGVPWISVNWDGWLLDDQTRIAAAYQTSIDQYAMTPPECGEAFRRVVSLWPASQVIVSTGDLPSRFKVWVDNAAARATDNSGAVEAPLSRHPRPVLGATYVAPTSELEQRVANIWQETLGIEPVGLHDNFFDLGGNSLLGLKVISRLRAELRIEIPVVRLFEGPTIQALAHLIGQQQNGQPPPEAARGRGQKRRERLLQKTRASG